MWPPSNVKQGFVKSFAKASPKGIVIETVRGKVFRHVFNFIRFFSAAVGDEFPDRRSRRQEVSRHDQSHGTSRFGFARRRRAID